MCAVACSMSIIWILVSFAPFLFFIIAALDFYWDFVVCVAAAIAVCRCWRIVRHRCFVSTGCLSPNVFFVMPVCVFLFLFLFLFFFFSLCLCCGLSLSTCVLVDVLSGCDYGCDIWMSEGSPSCVVLVRLACCWVCCHVSFREVLATQM